MRKIIRMFLFKKSTPLSVTDKKYLAVVLMIFIIAISGCKQQVELSKQQEKTLKSLTKIDNYPFYTMYYDGDYGLKQFINTGYKPEFMQNADSPTECLCTCFSAFGLNNSFLFGRNCDWHNHAALLLFTHPSDGFTSVTMVDIGVYGYSESNTPDNYDNRKKLLDAPYLCVDGMNECGVAIGEMSVPHAEPPYSASKRTITADIVIRLVLDYAKDCEDALRLIKEYNINFDVGEKIHYLIADSSGHSMLVEFLDNDIKVTRNTNLWQVSTNFIIFGASLPPLVDSGYHDEESFDKWRYVKTTLTLKNCNGSMTSTNALALLHNVSANFGAPYNVSTMWSIVYNLKARTVSVVINREIAKVYQFNLFSY